MLGNKWQPLKRSSSETAGECPVCEVLWTNSHPDRSAAKPEVLRFQRPIHGMFLILGPFTVLLTLSWWHLNYVAQGQIAYV